MEKKNFNVFQNGGGGMKYRVNVTLEGYIEVEADTEKEAIEYAEEGFAMGEFHCEDSDVFEAELA